MRKSFFEKDVDDLMWHIWYEAYINTVKRLASRCGVSRGDDRS